MQKISWLQLICGDPSYRETRKEVKKEEEDSEEDEDNDYENTPGTKAEISALRKDSSKILSQKQSNNIFP